jgi:Type II secretion system (T2SS), protein N
MLLLGLIIVVGGLVALLPASMLARALPPQVTAEDFSGSLWHGSAGRLTVNGREAGALEWRLHPLALFGLVLDTDLHWVKTGFLLDGHVTVDRQGLTARDLTGHGPLQDVRDLLGANSWSGAAIVDLKELRSDFKRVLAVQGSVHLDGLSSPQVASGADLGSYELTLPPDAVAADGALAADLVDTGGPVELKAQIHLAADAHSGLLSGTVKERPEAAASLRAQLENLAQLKPRDASGHIPVELEFSL